MKIDCKIAIPKELLNNTDTPLGVKAKESICVTGNIIDNNSNSNNNNKSKLKKKHKGINDKQKHKHNTPINMSIINLYQQISNTNTNINSGQCNNNNNNYNNITEPDSNYISSTQHIHNQLPYSSSNNQQTSAQILNSSFQTSSSSTHSSKSTPLYLRKLFLGGLPPHITTDELINYFSKFGTVERVLIMTDKNTGRARGFGFLIFSHKETVDKIISISTSHFLCGKWIECKRAHPKEQSVKMLSENNTSPSLNMNYNIDNDNLVLNDIVSNKSFALSGDKFRNENNLFMYQNYIPKTQTKYFLNNHNATNTLSQHNGDNNSSEQYTNNNVVNDDIDVNNSSSQKQFQYYFNNCIVNPSFQNYFHYKLFDKNGEDLSKLMLYKNSEKTTLFTEDYDKKNSNTNNNISNYNNNSNSNSNNTLSNINWVHTDTNSNSYTFTNTQNAEYLYYDKHTNISNNNVSNQSWIGNYFITNNNNNNNNPLGIDSVVHTRTHPQQQHSLLGNYTPNPNAMYVNGNGNDVDVSSDFVDESEKDIKVHGNSSDDCYGPNIHKRTPLKQSKSNDSFKPY